MPLKALSLWLLDEPMDKSYQMPVNWMPDQLSPEHHAYCMGDVEAPGIIARRLLNVPDDAPLQALLDAIDKHPGGKAYRVFEASLHTLVHMQRKGIPWSAEAAADLDTALAEEAEAAAADLLKAAPALEKPIAVPVKPTKKNPDPDPKMVYPVDDLLNPTKGLSTQVKAAIADAIFRETGKVVPLSDTGGPSLDAKTLAFEFPGSKVVAALNTLQGKAKARSMIAKYAASATTDSRLHPITGINTVTGRTSSQEPALQQVPRDPRFRAIFAASTGCKIIATDFSSIELRIAAALGVRAWRELQAILAWASGDRSPASKKASAVYQSVEWLFKNEPDLLPFLQATDPNTDIPERFLDVPQPYGRGAAVEEWGRFIAADLALWVHRIRLASGGDEDRLSFRAAYVSGLDPHLLTAIAMQAQGGHFDLQGKSPLAYLQGLSSDDSKTLKHKLKDARQGAKAVNFGSLYGQQPLGLHRYGVTGYGLTWSLEDAAAAHQAWFDLYPEIGLWHWLLKYAHKVKADILNPYSASEMRTTQEGGKVYRWYTLSGRKTVSPKITSAANFQDQGTGAEIALDALASLPEDVQDYLVNFVHDEVVLEVPADRITEVQAIVERTMISAADKYLLKFGIPTEVESSIGDCWIH
jgi:DNA polymerase-1